MPKVSVVVPVYNTAPYLDACIQSLLQQTLCDLQIICVDDGSTDGSGEMLDAYASRDSRVHVIHQENRGQSAARNAGIREAEGEYVYFLDSDDFLEADALERLRKEMAARRLDLLLFSPVAFADTEAMEAKLESYKTLYHRNGTYPDVYTGRELLEMQIKNKDYAPGPWGYMIRSAFLRENGIRFYEGIYHEDELFTPQCLLLAERAACIPDALYHRRLREGSVMTKAKSFRHAYGIFTAADELMRFLHAHQLEDCAGVMARTERQITRAYKLFRDLPAEEMGKLLDLPPEEQTRFRLGMLMARDGELLKQIRELKKRVAQLEAGAAGNT